MFFLSCEEVINVPLNSGTPRLVIDASINWKKGTNGESQKILLSTTTNFYSNIIPKVSGATVSVKSSAGLNYAFTEIPNTGQYECNIFLPIIGETYTLTVVYKGETYTATETMQSVTPITRIEQKNDGGFSKKEYEIKVFFDDPDTKNYYLGKFRSDIYVSPIYGVLEDKFTNGNENFWSFSDKDLKQGSVIDITHYGISESYYIYMSKLISVSSSSAGGSPFQTPPATVRGNIINKTNIDNYALGYFSLNEVDVQKYTIQ